MSDNGPILVAEHLCSPSRVGSDLNDVTFRIEKGEIHAILGDHNSGKDSFADLLSGGNASFTGMLKFEDKLVRRLNRATAIALGIQTIYMMPQLIPNLSILDNIYPKTRIKRGPLVEDVLSMKDLATRKLSLFATKLDLNDSIESCTENEKLIVSIVRSLCAPCKLLLVDEVTRGLSPAHVDALKAELSVQRELGKTILYLTNDVREVHNFADRVSFFDDGRVTATRDVSNLDRFDLVRLSYAQLYRRKELETTSFELFFLKSYYESVVQSMPTPLLVTNREGRVTFVNKLFCVCYTVEADSVIDRNLGELLSHVSRDRFDILEMPDHRKREVTKLTEVLLNLEGETVPTRIYVAPVFDTGDSLMGHLILFSDRSRSRLQMERYGRMLRENKRIPYFAHEIRNPLGIIRNFLNILRSKEMSDDSRECFLWIEKEVKRIDHLVGDLIAESTDRRKSTRGKKVDLRKLVEEIRNIVVSPQRGKVIEFVNEIPNGTAVHHDENGLREVIINLVINAVEALPKQGTIRVASDSLSVEGKRYFVIDVVDNGIGIEETCKQEIFNPLVSTKKGKIKRGLGLAICKDIIESLGGFISVESRPGLGSTFSVHLPA
jgi:PAS domain S-box-containing protein